MSYAAYGYGKHGAVQGFVAAFGLGILALFPEGLVPTFTCVVSEEIRIELVGREIRSMVMEADIRDESIKFEDRIILLTKRDS